MKAENVTTGDTSEKFVLLMGEKFLIDQVRWQEAICFHEELRDVLTYKNIQQVQTIHTFRHFLVQSVPISGKYFFSL